MAAAPTNSLPAIRQSSPLWLRIGFWACILIAVAAVVRRVLALANPPKSTPPQMAGLDAAFASHAALTLAHILPALAFVLVLPFYYFGSSRITAWAGRLVFPLGAVVGITAYAMSSYSVGGWTERSAVLLFNSLFLFSLARAWVYARHHDAPRQRRWLLRAVVILLGIATTRPVMGIFFATAQLTHLVPSQFFGIAFWIGFSINAIVVELWLHYRSSSNPALASHAPQVNWPGQGRKSGSKGVHAMPSDQSAKATLRDAGPNLGVLAILYMLLFCAGLYPVTAFAGKPYWPGPWEPASVIVPYFQSHATQVLTCMFLQSGAIICLGLCCASVVGRLHFLGVRSAGPWVALLGGFLTVFDSLAASFMGWTMIRPEVVSQPSALLSLYFLAYAFGGPGFSIPMGLFMAGVSVPALIHKLMPRWIAVLGLILAAIGELSWFHLISPEALFLIPLTRFPGFIWFIAVGFALPKTRSASEPASRSDFAGRAPLPAQG